ncbi:MAG: hypothetical protein V4732_17570 [Pseudomonadota bacterium]
MKAIVFLLSFFLFALQANAKEENVEVDATRIKANKDLPKVLYVVPWKDMESNKNTDQKLVLHDFFGDLYDPVLASSTNHSPEKEAVPLESIKK